jgi:ECF transporter S component (folate family)
MSKTKKLVVSGILVALSIVLTRLFVVNIEQTIRISFGFVPIMLAGMLLGPIWGLAVGGLADLLGCLLFGVSPFLPITLTSALVGLLAWLLYRLTAGRKEWLRVLISVSVTQIICSMFLQTLWLSLLMPGTTFAGLFFWRAVVALATIPIFTILLYAVLKSLRDAKLAGTDT